MFICGFICAQVDLDSVPKFTVKRGNIVGDPVNIGLIATDAELKAGMLNAGWNVADHGSVRNLVHEVESIIAGEMYKTAPVSKLYFLGRKQDIAFEQPSGKSPKHRHHVRFWRSDQYGSGGRPLWFGAATYDRSVGLSRVNGEITHHIAPDIDAERDKILDELKSAGQLERVYQVEGVGLMLNGRNGEGDRYYTDGQMRIGVLSRENIVLSTSPVELPTTTATKIKLGIWKSILKKIVKLF
jgi:hypothetical protein